MGCRWPHCFPRCGCAQLFSHVHSVPPLLPTRSFAVPPLAEYLDGVLAPAGVADANSNAIVGHGLSFLVGRTSYTFGLQVGRVDTFVL